MDFILGSHCTWRVVPAISIGVLGLSKNTRGHLIFADGWLLLLCTKGDIGATTRRTQNSAKRERGGEGGGGRCSTGSTGWADG